MVLECVFYILGILVIVNCWLFVSWGWMDNVRLKGNRFGIIEEGEQIVFLLLVIDLDELRFRFLLDEGQGDGDGRVEGMLFGERMRVVFG